MMTDPASAIRSEVDQLVELQIQTFKQESRLLPSQLLDYHDRSDQISRLYRELDDLARMRLDIVSVRAS
ncbi:MAG: hypothetical protein DMG89_07810 [Acidobacteria bacterium]|nr:MAG: hypothetical protein DMG89_07810 [Acidobacteriota bacterium]